MGNASSQLAPEDSSTGALEATSKDVKRRHKTNSARESQADSSLGKHQSHSQGHNTSQASDEQRKVRKLARKERKARARELASQTPKDNQDLFARKDSASGHRHHQEVGRLSSQSNIRGRSSKPGHKIRRSETQMDPNYPIDPNLREAEGTYHTTPPGFPLAQPDRQDYVQAPVANMRNTSAIQEAVYRKLLHPLVEAADQATQASHEDSQYGPPTLSNTVSNDLEQPTKKEAKRRGRPPKSKISHSQDGPDMNDAITTLGHGPFAHSNGHELGHSDDATPGDGNAMLEGTKKNKKRRKRVSGDTSDEQYIEGEGGEPQAKRPRAAPDEAEEEGMKDKEKEMRDSGPLSKLEWKYIERVIEEFKQENMIDQKKVNDFIQSTNRAQSQLTKDLWTRLYESLPHRQHVAVMRACRRRFNNFEVRGKWTPAEDDMLKQAYLEYPAKWVKIGSILDRMPEDCRDRWRNYLSCGDQRRIDDWTTKEEADLEQAVRECALAARQEAKEKAKEEGHAFREQDWEACVNFNTVSDKMKFTRSRLQCYTHWKVMQNRDPERQRKLESRRTEGPSNRQGRALANFNKMSPGEKYQIVCQIADTQAREEEEIPWKQITRLNPDSKWSTRDRKETFAKLKAELANDIQDLPSVITRLLDHFRSSFPVEQLMATESQITQDETSGDHEVERSAIAQDQTELQPADLTEEYPTDGPYFTAPQQYANEAQQLLQGQELGDGHKDAKVNLNTGNDSAPTEGSEVIPPKSAKKRGPKGPRKNKRQNDVEATDKETVPRQSREDSEEERRLAMAAEQLGQLAGGSNLTLAHHLYAAAAHSNQQSLDDATIPAQSDKIDSDRAQNLATLASKQLQEETLRGLHHGGAEAGEEEQERNEVEEQDPEDRIAGYPEGARTVEAFAEQDLGSESSSKRWQRTKRAKGVVR